MMNQIINRETLNKTRKVIMGQIIKASLKDGSTEEILNICEVVNRTGKAGIILRDNESLANVRLGRNVALKLLNSLEPYFAKIGQYAILEAIEEYNEVIRKTITRKNSFNFNDFVKTIIPLLGTDVTTSQANIVKILLPRYVVSTMLDLKLEAKENKVKRLVK